MSFLAKHKIPIKVSCSNCNGVNDEYALLWVCSDGNPALMTGGETKCWYCNKWFHWDLLSETIDKIFEDFPLKEDGGS